MNIEYLTTKQLAEKLGKKKLETILKSLGDRNLTNTAPYLQFKEIYDSTYKPKAKLTTKTKKQPREN